ncbi:MAG: Zn-ribbon containing protein [Nanoarchaeota archaeon]
MPHSCVHCSSIYPDASPEILNGCSKCGSKFFFYLTGEKLKKMKENSAVIELNSSERKQIEADVRDIVGISEDEDTPIIMDFESIKVIKPGKYIIDLHNLFTRERPLIYTLEDGKYIIDLTSQISGKEI